MTIYKAIVEKLLLTRPFGQTPKQVEKLEILLDGIKYDKHYGRSKLSDIRTVKLLPKGIETANLRMITLVSSEELRVISEKIGEKVLPDDLEANITLSNVKEFTRFLPGTILKFPGNALLFITAENLPCVIPSQNMIKRGVKEEIALKFSKAAYGARGLTAMTFASGYIKTGDEVEIIPPQKLE